MRIVIDYRPALRARTGVGEYIHQAAKALAENADDDITLFSSSWRDRPDADLAVSLPRVRILDHRIPVRALNLAWHRLEWPVIETIAGRSFDVAHSPHPLLLPSRSAATLVTIHDLHFLEHPERVSREIRRDYAALAGAHARRADRIIVSSDFASREVQRAFGIDAEKISVCPAGRPDWADPATTSRSDGYILFLGTLDARKNVGGLIQAYAQLLSRWDATGPGGILPPLYIAGGAGAGCETWLQEIERAPLAGRVKYLGYVPGDQREALFRGACLFVLPSFEEGFGLPVLEAMTAGVPVVASDRGSLPELVGDAGLLIDPDAATSLSAAIERVLVDRNLGESLVRRGLDRSKQFTWTRTASDIRCAYDVAVLAHRQAEAAPIHAHRH